MLVTTTTAEAAAATATGYKYCPTSVASQSCKTHCPNTPSRVLSSLRSILEVLSMVPSINWCLFIYTRWHIPGRSRATAVCCYRWHSTPWGRAAVEHYEYSSTYSQLCLGCVPVLVQHSTALSQTRLPPPSLLADATLTNTHSMLHHVKMVETSSNASDTVHLQQHATSH